MKSIIFILLILASMIFYLLPTGNNGLSLKPSSALSELCPALAELNLVSADGGIGAMNIIDGNSLLPVAPLYLLESRIYADLIDCLAFRESSNNPLAINPNDPITASIGLLQFKEKTFQYFCVNKYGFKNDIWDAEIQRACCSMMIEDGNLNHWSTAKFCK